ncbi:ABC transporter permease subunit [Cellulomonas sp. KRMCY2]|uniref:ABC transporter permease subunit n=1 Tax=Cellulomonas sp. KRMCY2 TaxID=1304865 RepID=UPI00045EA463|nr:ABC transporter permease subunit [Cellulomonas sp. KRMCY2]
MNRLIRAELHKLRTTRSTWWLLLAQIGLVALLVTGAVLSSAITEVALETPEGLRTALSHGGVPALLALIVGITAIAGEYRQGTIAGTFLVTPKRSRVVAAKLVAFGSVGLVSGLLSAGMTLAATAAWMAARDVAFEPTSRVVILALVGIVLWNVLYALMGVALGGLLRAVPTAIGISVVWLMLVENAVVALAPDVARWLPATAAAGLVGSPAPDLLSRTAGGLALAAWTLALVVLAARVTDRRDVA